MKRWLLMVGCLLGLASCAPTQQAALTDPGTATLTLNQRATSQVISFSAGSQDAVATLTLTGAALSVNDKSCTVQAAQLVCALGSVPAGRTYVLPSRGVSKVQASYSRADGKTYALTAP